MELKTKPEYEALLPKISNEELIALRESIRNEGLHYAIAVNEEGVILDGHHRYRVCQQLCITPRIIIKSFKDKLAEKKFVIESNLRRRHLTVLDKTKMAMELEKIEAEQKAQKMASQPRAEDGTFQPIVPNGTDGKAMDIVAEKVGLSPMTYHRAKTVLEKGSPELQAEVQNGDKTISRAYNEIKQAEKHKVAMPPILEGKYQTIVIDPPWDTEKILRDVRPNQNAWEYPVMNVEEIKEFPIKKMMADNCHVYLWTTHKYLPDAFEVFKAWGVKYECLLTWVKNVGFTPFSWMYSTEHILFGRVGSLGLMQKGLRLDFSASVREHSRKPNEFYELVKKASPEPRIDMFAREKHDGFTSWGNEVGKFVDK